MEVALKAYKSIGTVEGLKKALEETGYVPDRVKITANKVDKKRSDLPVKDDHIETPDEAEKIKEEESERKDQAEIQRLIDELAERERELEAKQNELNKAIAQTKSLNKKLSSKDEEIERLREDISELQKETRKKGDALEAAHKAISELKKSDTEVSPKEPVSEKKQDRVEDNAVSAGNNSTIAFINNQLEEDARMRNVVPIYYTVPVRIC